MCRCCIEILRSSEVRVLVRAILRFKNEAFIRARKAAGFETQTALALALNVHPNTVCAWEGFGGYPGPPSNSQSTLWSKLEALLKVPYEVLFPAEYIDAVNTKAGRQREVVTEVLALPYHEDLALPPYSEEYERNEIGDLLNQSLATLNPRERSVLEFRCGLNGKDEHTLDGLVPIFKVTRERVRQIQEKALRKLRQPKRSRILTDGYLRPRLWPVPPVIKDPVWGVTQFIRPKK
jgi:RNA polymerase sigma factor (sigma-70 family)